MGGPLLILPINPLLLRSANLLGDRSYASSEILPTYEKLLVALSLMKTCNILIARVMLITD